MRIGCRSVALATTLAAVLAFGAPAFAVPPANKCSAAKIGLVAKHAAGLLKCYSKAVAGGTAVDALCTGKTDTKIPLGMTKVDGGQVPSKPASVCAAGSNNYPGIIQPQVNANVLDLATDLDPGFTLASNGGPSKCTAGKIGCAAKLEAGLLKCHSKSLGKSLALDPLCTGKNSTKFNACYTKLNTADTGGNPGYDCVVGPATNDAPAIEAKIGRFVDHISNYYSGFVNQTPGCASQIVFAGTSTKGVLDTGWTGQGHDATVISEGTVTVAVSTCTGDATAPTCGICSYHGPVPNGTGKLQVGRCSNDSSKQCITDTICGIGNTCKSFFGSYLPLAAGGVSTCVENAFSGAVTGTTNYATGDSAGAAKITSRVFTGDTLSHPCPRCIGDATANDGTKGGTCNIGPNATKTCDASGSSPNASFGTTSLDCPPTAGGLIATLPIDLSNTTGNKTKTLSAATSPPCTDGTFVGGLCQCDTCNNAAATPCSSNADCVAVGATVCGGLRCTGGSNNGAVCSVASQCPGVGGACSVPGAATAGNQCDGGIGDCLDNPQVGDPNKRTCGTGPSESFCAPVETFRGCSSNAQCGVGVGGAPGDLCTLTRFRDCFDNGLDTEVVTASGVPDAPVAHVSDPTLATLFCIGPTTAGAVNSAAGLPGLGRLELGGHATDNGTS